ncbi:phage tail protein [Leuconostoc mesenteroides]|uniref:phage tail spike protein n=1 Tax=Leuconostoc mesenteroides TaxID=1245 RepID=UPI001CBF8520|nr:phage tail spike protein [Leuconostoc mesenteroides]MBZ1530154.1 phage tail protein [Leuconostoc mesenteroides]
MIYIFDKKQAIIKVLTNDDFTAAHLNFKINTATTFEFSLPASKALPSGSKYVATPHPLNDSKFIMLRLTERIDKTETIDYSAYELAYQELATDGYIEDKRPHNQSALNLMKIALDGSNWELNNVNVSGTATTNFYYVDRLSAISKVVDLLGGEIVFYIEIQGNAISGRYMDYLARQGADTSKVFASGSNLLTVERQSDTSNIYTAILPRGKGEEIDNGEADTPDGYGRRINIADVEWKKSAGKPLDKPKGSIVLSDPDATAEWGQINGNARLLLQTYDDIDDVNVLINSAYKTLQSVNHPQIQYSATVADVGGLSLGDTVLIMHGDRDLSYKTRVFEVKYDLLSPDQTELSLGDDLSSNSITSQINNLNAVADTTSSQTQWTINQIGRPGTTYGATTPDSPKVGDIWFKYLPDGSTEIYRWNGDIWELLASPTTANDIAAAVDDAVSQAKSRIDEVKQVLSTDIETAKSQAASQASTAEANAKSEAVSQFNRAQNALSDAKTDLTKSIASEASARSEAVAHANSQAQTYANQAKADALNTTAKEVTDRQNAVSELDTKAQGYVNTAKSDVLETVHKEVTDRQQSVSALDTKATDAINQAKSDITDTINALSVGGRNYFITNNAVSGYLDADRGVHPDFGGGDMTSDFIVVSPNETWQITSWSAPNMGGNIIYAYYDSNKSFITGSQLFTWVPDTKPHTTISITIPHGVAYMRVSSQHMDHNQGAKIKVEKGTKPTDWTPAPEDVVLDYTTKDNQIKETITQYKDTNDGKVRKAQTDATTALGLVETKVSQTDYDKKTGDLSTKYTQVKQTADSQATDIVDIKKTATSQDSKINSISSDVDGTKQSISDIKKTQDSQSDKVNQITNDVNGTKQSITDIQNKDGKQDTRMGTIETSVSGVKSDFSSYKTTNDGVVKTAQTTAQTAVDGLKNKVSQTDYDKKTGQLQTDLTTTTQTANQAKTDIASINKKDGEQDEKMNTIVSDANGTKQTVSDLQTAQEKQSGYISELKQKADGFEATVTKVDNLSIGGRNYFITNNAVSGYLDADRGVHPDFGGGDMTSDFIVVSPNETWQITSWSAPNMGGNIIYAYYDSNKSFITGSQLFTWVPDTKPHTTISITIPHGVAYMRVSSQHMGRNQGAKVKVETGTSPTDWTPAPEDLSGATAKAQLTADNASLAINNYKTDADGRISKAQSDIKANATAITQKVSQTVYDQKTGDLSTKINDVKHTADSSAQTIADIKTADGKQDARMAEIENNASGLKSTVSNLSTEQGKQSGYISKLQQRADGFDATVTKVNNLSVGGRNLLLGTATPWTVTANSNNYNFDSIYDHLKGRTTYTFSAEISVSNGQDSVSVSAYDAPIATPWGVSDKFSKGVKRGSFTFTTPDHIDNDGHLLIYAGTSEHTAGLSATYTHMKLEEGTIPTDWTPAPEDVQSDIAQVKITADSISNFVRDSSGNISSDFQTALSKTSIITGSTLASSIQKQTSSQISSAITDNNGKIISLINQDSSGVQIAGKNLAVTADTTVDGNFWAKQVNSVQVNASNINVGTLNGNQVNITNVNAANITGDITNFIQSNWNGVYGSTAITSSGMTVTSPGTVALFNVNGMTLDGAGGMTRVANGFTQIYSATHENIGMIGHQKDVDHDNVDYITFGLNGYRTTNDGDSHWVGGSDFYGGDGMGFGVSNKKGTYDLKLRWDSDLIAGYKGELQGWHASDQFIFDNKTFHKGYADFSGGVTMSGAYSEGTRSLHTQGMSISTGAKWFGFMDGSNSTGFGTDQTQDVLFYVKGQVYSLYTMLGKLGMR